MSILIEGMMMPEAGQYSHIRIYGGNGDVTVEDIEGYELTVGTAVPVPPHGKLIDADAFTKDECNNCDGACEALPCDCLNCEADCRCDFMKDIANAPTIIPASEEGKA